MIDWGAPTGHGIPARGATPGYRMGVDRVLKERRIGSPESVGAVAAVSFSAWAPLGWSGPQEPGGTTGAAGAQGVELSDPDRRSDRELGFHASEP